MQLTLLVSNLPQTAFCFQKHEAVFTLMRGPAVATGIELSFALDLVFADTKEEVPLGPGTVTMPATVVVNSKSGLAKARPHPTPTSPNYMPIVVIQSYPLRFSFFCSLWCEFIYSFIDLFLF